MAKKDFSSIPNASEKPFTQRDLDILIDKTTIMKRQNGDMSAQLAEAEAINRRLVAEYAQLRGENERLTKELAAKKGKRG